MDREKLEQDVERLAELAGQQVRTDAAEAELTGLAIGLAGTAVIALVRIADALSLVTEPDALGGYLRVREG